MCSAVCVSHTLYVAVCSEAATLLTATASPIMPAVHFTRPLLPNTRVSPAFHHQQMLMQSLLLNFVYCPLAVRDTEGNGNQGQSPRAPLPEPPCQPQSAHGQQPSQRTGLQQD